MLPSQPLKITQRPYKSSIDSSLTAELGLMKSLRTDSPTRRDN